MTLQETQLLQNFLDQLREIREVNKDAQAAQMIGEAFRQQTDAAYLVVQRAILLEQALGNAQSQIASLQDEVRDLKATSSASASSSFLDPAVSAWGNSVSSRPLTIPGSATGSETPPGAGMTTSVTGAAIPAYGTPPAASAFGSSNMATASPTGGFLSGHSGSMLGTVAATAAGVAAGAFLFQGLGNLLGNNQQHLLNDAGGAQLAPGSDDLLPGYFDQDTASDSLNIDSQDNSDLI